MKFLAPIIQVIRVPFDILFLTFHFLKGTIWLLLISVKRKFGMKTKSWPYGCFTEKTSSGHCACIPGRKYGNHFLFHALCTDSKRDFKGNTAKGTFCSEKLQMSKSYWRPPIVRLCGIGILLILVWGTVLYGLFQILPSTKKNKFSTGERYLAKAREFADQGKYKEALFAYYHTMKNRPRDPQVYLELGTCLTKLNRISEGIQRLSQAVSLSPGLWEAHLEIARLSMQERYYQSAVEHANAVSRKNPDLAEPFLIASFCLQKQGKIQEAKKALDKGLKKLSDQEPDQIEIAAGLCETLKDHAQAKTLYQKALVLNPESVDAQIGLAKVFLSLTQWDSALEMIDKVFEKDAENEQALICRAELALAKGKFQMAAEQYQEIIKRFPKNPQPQARLASILYSANQQEKASEILRRTLHENPDYVDALLLFARINLEQKRYRLAVENALRVVRLNYERMIIAQKILARAYVELKEYQKAIESATFVLKSEPKDFISKLMLAYSYHHLGEKEKAVQFYSQAAELNPNSILPDVYMGTLFSKNGEINPAISSFRRAQKKSPDDKRLSNNLAMLLLDRGKKEDIEEAFNITSVLITKHKENAIITDTFGWVLFHRGDYEEAEKVLNKAIHLNPNLPDAYYHLGKTLVKKEILSEAEKNLSKSLKLAKDFKGAKDAKNLLNEIQRKLKRKEEI